MSKGSFIYSFFIEIFTALTTKFDYIFEATTKLSNYQLITQFTTQYSRQWTDIAEIHNLFIKIWGV